jgi:hypothetical protein
MIISSRLDTYTPSYLQPIYDRVNSGHWESLIDEGDWALDISDMSGTCDLRGVPAGVIRRDPETQVVMTFEQALEGSWKAVLGPENGTIAGGIKLLLDGGFKDTVLIADRASPEFRSNVAALRELQRIGAALPE